jgi:hypothetical protein
MDLIDERAEIDVVCGGGSGQCDSVGDVCIVTRLLINAHSVCIVEKEIVESVQFGTIDLVDAGATAIEFDSGYPERCGSITRIGRHPCNSIRCKLEEHLMNEDVGLTETDREVAAEGGGGIRGHRDYFVLQTRRGGILLVGLEIEPGGFVENAVGHF